MNFLHTRPRGLWVPPTVVTGAGTSIAAFSYYPSAELVDAVLALAYMAFSVPADFTTLVKASIVVIPGGTGDLRRSGLTTYGANGQVYTTHTGVITVGVVAVVINQLFEIDITSTLASLAAGDYVGVEMTRSSVDAADTVNATVHCLGLWIEYY